MSAHSAFRTAARAAILGIALVAAAPFARAADDVKPLVDDGWLEQHLGQDDVVVLDLRVPGKDGYLGGHIPGSVSAHYPGAWRAKRDGVSGVLPELSQIEAYISGLGIGDGDTVVVVPAGTDATDFGGAARVYWTFKELGHDQVTILNGGLSGWTQSGHELQTAAVEPEPDLFTAEPRDKLLVSTDQMTKKIGTKAVLVDARPPEYFAGKEKHPDAPRYGRLPGAVDLPHDTFYDAENHRLRPVDELQKAVPAVVQKARADNDEIVSYCNTGHWAATDWFVLSQLLGYDVALYDDSMVGWTQDPSREVESERTRLDDLKAWIMGNS